MGLSVSDAVRVFLIRVVAETHAAMSDADEMVRNRRARFDTATELFDDIEKNRCK